MKSLPTFLTVTFILLINVATAHADETVHHQLEVTLDPQSSKITVSDTIRIPGSLRNALATKGFMLNPNFTLEHTQLKVRELKSRDIKRYAVQVKNNKFTVRYSGKLSAPTREHAQDFSSGVISEQGVFLSSAALWFPRMGDELLSFTLNVKLPDGWHSISNGAQINTQGKEQWSENHPQDDIYLVAGQYHVYKDKAGDVLTQVYLREDDPGLAKRYLDTSKHYLAMYGELLGAYPYKKFAVVENFWDTGYGMPSFTLLGPRVIRFPFILHTSLPHEILHNWWGNGIFVDYTQGNWSEGLTAYLSDHLIKDQRNQGAAYRRDALQKYTDYVNSGQDFPISEFTAKHSDASEAVGYGKTLMLFHMVRQHMVDDAFFQALRDFYKDNKYQFASFNQLIAAFNKHMNSPFNFKQWITRTGAPELAIKDAKNISRDGKQLVTITLQQKQKAAAFALDVPIKVDFDNNEKPQLSNLSMTQKKQTFELALQDKPAVLSVDPDFDLFRRLDPAEIPASLSQGFGSTNAVIVLPTKESNSELKTMYGEMAQAWIGSLNGNWKIVNDDEISSLPKDKTVWLFGKNNRFSKTAESALHKKDVTFSNDGFTFDNKDYLFKDNSFTFSFRNPENKTQSVLWLSAHSPQALPGLSRKIPHYRKYGVVVFEGDAPNNILKHQWMVSDSPLSWSF